MTVPPTLESLLAIEGRPNGLMMLSDAILTGLPVEAVERVVDLVSPRDHRFQHTLIPRSTLLRRRACSPARLSPDEGNRLFRLAKAVAAAWRATETDEEARRLLLDPHPLLDGRAPYRVALTSTPGTDAVLEVFESGLPSRARHEAGHSRFGSRPSG